MFVTDLHIQRIPDIYRQFAHEIGEKHWRDRVTQCKQAIKGNDFLREHLQNENSIAYQLDHLGELIRRYGGLPAHMQENQAFYPAASFAAQVASIIDGSSSKDAERFRRRVHGAFRNPDDMRGLRLELSSATHFARRGKKIIWPETQETGTFDLLVEGIDQDCLEVECKSISPDKGRKIHKRDVLEFYGLLKPYLGATTRGLATGMSVVLTLPSRLPSSHQEKRELAKQLGSAVFAGTSCTLHDGSNIRISDFDVQQLGDLASTSFPREIREIADGITETPNRHTMIVGTGRGGALALAVQSSQDDSLMKAVFDTLSDAAKRQLSGRKAGMLFVGFHGIDAEQMLSVGAQDQDPSQTPTALRVAVSRFLTSSDRDHIIGVAFVSESGLHPTRDGSFDSGGTAYYFPKRESSFWSAHFNGMFTWAAPATS